MQIDALVGAPLIVAAVLVASAIGKLADPRRAALGFDALDVPRALAQPWMRAAHPWAELLLAFCLVVTSGISAMVTAIVATALAAAYLVLIVRAVTRPEPTDCACFGVGGAERVSGWTVARNGWLFGLAGVCLWAAADGRSPLQRAIELGANAWWLAAMVAAATMTALIVHSGAPTPEADAAEDLEDYERTQIPHVPVTLADGTVTSLRDLASARPKLIIFVSGGCSGCGPTIEATPQWRADLPEVDVHLLYATNPDEGTSPATEPQNLYDVNRFATEALGLSGTPSAVLLGTDGMLAGGPVAGHAAVRTFVADVEAELAGARLLSR